MYLIASCIILCIVLYHTGVFFLYLYRIILCIVCTGIMYCIVYFITLHHYRLYHFIFYCIVLCRIILYCIVSAGDGHQLPTSKGNYRKRKWMNYIVLYHIVWHTVSYFNILYQIVLCNILLFCIVYYRVQNCSILYQTLQYFKGFVLWLKLEFSVTRLFHCEFFIFTLNHLGLIQCKDDSV